MELRVLNYFLIVAREENITKAAQILHITQPTLSRQLMQLEDELGVKLFKRSNHKVILTEDGILLRRRAQEIVALAEKTKNEFRMEENLSGEITIGSGEYKCSRLLADIIASFRERNPLVKFDIMSGNSDDIKYQIERGSIDIGLLLEPVDVARYDFIRMPVQEEWGVLVREDSELAKLESVRAEDMEGQTLIMTRRESVQGELRSWLGAYADRVEYAATGNLTYNVAQLVASGVGIFPNIHLNCTYDGLRFVPLSPQLTSGTLLAWKKSQPHSAATKAFLEYTRHILLR